MNGSHPDTELYKTLREEYSDIVVENGIYIIPQFGYQFGIQETDGEINLIYKGRIIKTYSIYKSVVKKVVGILDDCLFTFDNEECEMFTCIGLAHVIWYVRNIFYSGSLYIGEGIHVEDPWEEPEYIEDHLTVRELSGELFKRRPDLPFLNFKCGKQSFIYI